MFSIYQDIRTGLLLPDSVRPQAKGYSEAGASITRRAMKGFLPHSGSPNEDINWFVGNILALLVPAVIVVIGSVFSKYEYDFAQLKVYEPDHVVH